MSQTSSVTETPVVKSFVGSMRDDRCLEVWFADKVTDATRAWLLEAVNEKALRAAGVAPTLGLEPVAWRYRYITSWSGDWSDWFIVDDVGSIPNRADQVVEPLYTTSPDTSTDRTSELALDYPSDRISTHRLGE